jgi:hypothetical protein
MAATPAAHDRRMDDAPLIDTWIRLPDEPDWGPLVAVARLSRSSDVMPSLDECDFMYMGAVSSVHDALDIHLYKHRETRRYLNLDEAGHAYQYCGPLPGHEADLSGGKYRLHRSLVAALVHAVAADPGPPVSC